MNVQVSAPEAAEDDGPGLSGSRRMPEKSMSIDSLLTSEATNRSLTKIANNTALAGR